MPAADAGVPLVDRAERVARRHHTNPWNERIGDEHDVVRCVHDEARRVEDAPERIRASAAIEQVVASDQDRADRADAP